jgi:hypothetical protein
MTTIAEQLAETRKRSGVITHDEAQQMLCRFIASHFRRGREEGEHARITIPADPHRDDDLRLDAYIEQQRSAAASTQALREAAERLLTWLDNEAPDGLPAHESDYFSLDMRVSVIALRAALAALETKP